MNFLLFATEMYALEIMQPLEAEISKTGHNVAWFFSKPIDEKYKAEKIILTTVAEVMGFDPAAVFVPGNWVPDFFPGVKVQIFHGFGIEKKGHFQIRGFFDLYCTHGELTTKPFQQLAEKHGNFMVIETGWPKIDPLFLSKKRPQNAKTTILYAPTFSPSLTSAIDLFESIKKLASTEKYDWIVKFHPKMDPTIIRLYESIESAGLSISREPQILPLLLSTDLMISDTSSVIYEYILLEKPVITFRNTNPGAHTVDFIEASKLEGVIESTWKNKAQITHQARAVSQKMHPYQDGKSSARVLQAALDFITNPPQDLKNKPLNLFRKWKARKQLKYYRF